MFDELLTLHNEYRKKFKLGPLALDDSLSAYADGHSKFMDRKNKLNHDGFYDRMSSIKTAIAENVGYSPSATACFNMWIGSKGHDENIRGAYTKVGFGKSGNYWTVIFS